MQEAKRGAGQGGLRSGRDRTALIKLADRFERLLVRAPSDGIVQELTPKSIGEVVKAGDRWLG